MYSIFLFGIHILSLLFEIVFKKVLKIVLKMVVKNGTKTLVLIVIL